MGVNPLDYSVKFGRGGGGESTSTCTLNINNSHGLQLEKKTPKNIENQKARLILE